MPHEDFLHVSPSKTQKRPRYIDLLGTRIWLQDSCSLESDDSEMPLADVPRKKKKELKYIDLLGTRIWLPGSFFLKSTPLADIRSSSSLMDIDEDLSTPCSEDDQTSTSLSLELSLSSSYPAKREEDLKTQCALKNKNAGFSRNPNARPNITYSPRYEEQREEEVENQNIIPMGIPIYTWNITKTLTLSDVNTSSRLMLDTCTAENHILRHLSPQDQELIQEGAGVDIKVYDHDKDSEHDLVFKRMVKTTRSYIFKSKWGKDFVRRRKLVEGDRIGLFWGFRDSRLHFCVLSRAPPGSSSKQPKLARKSVSG